MNNNISVIVPNFNHAKFLDKRLNSIFQQSRKADEVIILDDCSTDNSDEIINLYINRKNVTYIKNFINSGNPFKQWLKGIQSTQGEFIWIAESDDFADTNFLEKTSSVLEKNNSVGLVYTRSKLINENDDFISSISVWNETERWKESFIDSGENEIINFPQKGTNLPNASAVLFRKSFFDEKNDNFQKFKYAGDWFFWLEIMKKSLVGYINEDLNYFRQHTANTTSNGSINGLALIESYEIIRQILKSGLPTEKAMETLKRYTSTTYLTKINNSMETAMIDSIINTHHEIFLSE